MAEPSSALGFPVDFDNDGFRNAIRFAMQMGRNPDDDKRIIFLQRGSGDRTYWKNDVQLMTPPLLDRDGVPVDADIEVRIPEETEILDDGAPVDCAIEVEPRDANETPVGNFRPTKIVVTFLDGQYQLIKDCRKVIYNGDEYMFGYEPESNGLFEVGVYTIIYYARDDS